MRSQRSRFELDDLPRHLLMNIKVTDSNGRVTRMSRDLEELLDQTAFSGAATKLIPNAVAKKVKTATKSNGRRIAGPSFRTLAEQSQWNFDGLKTWPIAELPVSIKLRQGSTEMTAFPALIDAHSEVKLRLKERQETAEAETRQAVFRLFAFEAHARIKKQIDYLPAMEQLDMYSTAYPAFEHVRKQLIELIAQRSFLFSEKVPRNESAYRDLIKRSLNRLPNALQDVADVVKQISLHYRSLVKDIEDLNAPSWGYAKLDMKQQLEGIFRPRFLTKTPWQYLSRVPWYIQGMKTRCQKLRNAGLDKDRRAYQELATFLSQLKSMKPEAVDHNPALQEFRWLIEEYRIQLFAQQLKTSQPVSAKRLERQWKKVIKGA